MFLQVREKEVVAIAGGFIEHAGEDWRTSMQVVFQVKNKEAIKVLEIFCSHQEYSGEYTD